MLEITQGVIVIGIWVLIGAFIAGLYGLYRIFAKQMGKSHNNER